MHLFGAVLPLSAYDALLLLSPNPGHQVDPQKGNNCNPKKWGNDTRNVATATPYFKRHNLQISW